MCAAAVAATFAAPVAVSIADAVAAATADAVKDVASGVRTAGVNSLAAPGVTSGVRTAGVNSLAAPARGCDKGVAIDGEFSLALVAQKGVLADVGEARRLLEALLSDGRCSTDRFVGAVGANGSEELRLSSRRRLGAYILMLIKRRSGGCAA